MGKRAKGDPESRKTIIKWLKDGLKLRQYTSNDAAEHIGMLRSHGPKLISGDRRITADEMFALSRFLQLPVPKLGAPDGSTNFGHAPVVCRVNNEHWTSRPLFHGCNGGKPKETFPLVPTIPWAGLQDLEQFSVVVDGDMIENTIRDGEFAICVDYHTMRKEITPGDFVLAEVERAGLYNAFVLKLDKADGHWTLQTTRNGGKPEAVMTLNEDCTAVTKPRSDEKVTFIGLVISRYAPLSSL